MSTEGDRDAESILENHAEAHLLMNKEIAGLIAKTYGIENRLHDVEHRLVVMERRMENVLARLDGHDLGFATMSLDAEGKKGLARMLRRGRTTEPEEKGTSES